ncbi:MAG: hypothetical protein KGN16_10360 [Burkholderiales bacterium]|nr:hypothetical protein [Burkholderiales bacterium]
MTAPTPKSVAEMTPAEYEAAKRKAIKNTAGTQAQRDARATADAAKRLGIKPGETKP